MSEAERMLAKMVNELLHEVRSMRAELNELRAHLGDLGHTSGGTFGTGGKPRAGSARSKPRPGAGRHEFPPFGTDFAPLAEFAKLFGSQDPRDMMDSLRDYFLRENDNWDEAHRFGNPREGGRDPFGRTRRRAGFQAAEPAAQDDFDDEDFDFEAHSDGLDHDFDHDVEGQIHPEAGKDSSGAINNVDPTAVTSSHIVGGVDIAALIDKALRDREARLAQGDPTGAAEDSADQTPHQDETKDAGPDLGDESTGGEEQA